MDDEEEDSKEDDEEDEDGDDDDDYLALFLGSLEDALFDGALRHQAVYRDVLCLADPVASIHGLGVVGRVPIAVVEDDGVGRGQIDAQASRLRGEQEDEYVRTWRGNDEERIRKMKRNPVWDEGI